MKKLFYFTFIFQFIISAPIKAQWFGPATEKHLIPSESFVYSDYDLNREKPREGLYYDKYGYWTDNYWIMDTGKRHHIQEHDHSKGYPILLNDYKYSESEEGISAPKYEMRTTLNEAGIRTSIVYANQPSSVFTFDEAGHVLSCTNESSYESMTWDGDKLTSFKFDLIFPEKEIHLVIDKINILNGNKPFNAYLNYYHHLFFLNNPAIYLIAMNASGSYCRKDENGIIHTDVLSFSTEIEEDGKGFTTTHKIGNEVQEIIKVIYTDNFGSYTLREVHPEWDQYYETVYLYNEYGDYTKKIYRDGDSQGITKEETQELFEWLYDDNGKPLEITRYQNYRDGIPEYHTTEVFTAWHAPSTMNDANIAQETTLLGGALYNINGTFVRTIPIEEIQTNNIHATQKGIYLLIIKTNQGIQTRKIAITE